MWIERLNLGLDVGFKAWNFPEFRFGLRLKLCLKFWVCGVGLGLDIAALYGYK